MNQSAAPHTNRLPPFKVAVWFICIPAWVFGVVERSINAFSHHHFLATDLVQILTAMFFLWCWLMLKPAIDLSSKGVSD